MRALEAVYATLGLDYAGIDFGLSAEGTILVFEANATMAVYRPEVIAAVRDLLVSRAKTAGYT
jgi:glutathione synthase/RimK-type ligase-like ATP-grasp enzyme